MCLTGYVHKNRKSIEALAESTEGPAAKALSSTAVKLGAFIVAGFAEKVEREGILYNSAFVFAPDGTLVCRYRKINAETRWAAPGLPNQYNIFQTPWGGVGLLICADSYHALIPRITALKGASLILLPSNWPETDGFPELLWRQRAFENGIWLVAVNRGGSETEIDFTDAKTQAFNPMGQMAEIVVDSVDNRLRLLDIPLNKQGLIEDLRKERFEDRCLEFYHRIYGNLSSVRNLTSCLHLPKPGLLDFHAVSPGDSDLMTVLAKFWPNFRPGSLVLIPQAELKPEVLERLEKMAEDSNLSLVGGNEGANLQVNYFGLGKNIKKITVNDGPWSYFEVGPARIALTSLRVLAQPEAGVALAKDGVDLALCPERDLTQGDLRLISLRPIEQLAVGACSLNSSQLSLIPQGHGPGRGASIGPGQALTYVVDTRETRDKHFQDRVDYETVFGTHAIKSVWSIDDM
jgi:predicted amidohydrolase